jgi:hypothetical protein
MFRRKIARKAVWQLSAILLVVSLAISQARAGDIRGGVYRQTRFSSQPVPFFGARVELLLPSRQVVLVSYAGPDGLYQMRNVKAGAYVLRVNGTTMFPLTVLSTSVQDVPPIRISQ